MYLNWKKEIKALESTISSACYALRSLREEVTLEQLKMVYFALVESKLRYSIIFWGNSYKYNIKAAFVLQKRAIRTMLRIPQIESCKEHFRNLGILTVPSLYILVSLTHLVKNFHKYETYEERKKRDMTRRKDLKISITPTLNVVRHSTRYQAIGLFNSLPTSFKTIYCHHKFQNKLKSLLIKKSYYSVDDYLNDKDKLNQC
ncbi:unnamed protein product [Parnassius mnemosyne]|uniref:Reverse transcriptase N-terminal domain-containing protein n=1 Tax=Parnassius mnemosyne TaxID=213953 RepID=A0AAV1M3D6_9NEOP